MLSLKLPKFDEWKITLDRGLLVFSIFIMYFCEDLVHSVFARLIGKTTVYYLVYNVVLLTLFACYVLKYNKKGEMKPALICYGTITLLFILTVLLHPDYWPWIFEKSYGIQVQFFRLKGGIWAFLVLLLCTDRKQLMRDLTIAVWLFFFYLFFKYITALRQGYWIDYGPRYEERHQAYSLGYGYDMLFPCAFFACQAVLNKKWLYWLPFALSTFLILTGGSRGAIVFVAAAFVIMFPFMWRTFTRKQKKGFLIAFAIAIPILIIVILNFKPIGLAILSWMTKHGIKSRTLYTILRGEFSNSNGRDKIYALAISRIRTGGLFGNGVFGERVAVGTEYRWGYAHNFFLEVYAAFGYLGGTLSLLVLTHYIIKAFKICREPADQVIFLTFFIPSLKLMLSDSFWFCQSFWAMLGVIVLFCRQEKNRENETLHLIV